MDRPGTAVRAAPAGLGESLRRLGDALVALVREHLRLAREELRADLKKAGRDIAMAAAGLPAVLVGYLLLMAALAVWIGNHLGMAWGLAIVGGANFLGGASIAGMAVRKLAKGDAPDLDRTAATLREDGRWLKELR